ncbi:uncharacterized protein LOC105662571 [Megachile rotundata]|uniref:uncharacterized protein LOC105662571 n=1 Tax=Megachile rotundata TaxID=143995 RepID=UPI0006151A66|nr:PREDICTED: uncharacterized protein LOC105662571 [Megachile rotundata]XP_012141491.1 PREDICTED: uncharacterized protein LOC105662571 [Megachile rotundata]
MQRVQRAVRAAFLAATLIAFVRVSAADSRLSLQCKNIARDVIINSCKGPRIKRAAPRLDLEVEDKKFGITEAPDMAAGVQQKRQYFPMREPIPSGIRVPPPGLFPGIGLPSANVEQNSFHKTELNIPGLGYVEDEGSVAMEESYVPEFPNPYRPAGYFPAIRSIKPDELLGFDLSSDELEELYEEVGDRLPRNSKDFKKKIFQTVATKCCPNPKLCYDNPSLIPCMGY